MRNFLIILASSTLIILFSIIISFEKNFKREELVGDLYSSLKSGEISGEIDISETKGHFEGKELNVPENILFQKSENILGTNTIGNPNKWIEVDLSEQKLRAWEGNKLFLETLVSTGLPWWPTPKGEFRIWIKLRSTKMEGGSGKYYYYLPNVPYVMYIQNNKVPGWKGYGLHGTYWHNDFGRPRSHGCVNLPTEIAEKLYYWADPVLPEGKKVVRATEDNPGTRVIIHD